MVNFSIRNMSPHPLLPLPLGEGCLKDRVRVLCIFFLIFIFAYFLIAGGCGEMETTLSSLTIDHKNTTVGINKSVLFNAIGRDSTGKLVSITPTWSVIGGIGTITSGGLFTAGSTTGEGKVLVTNGDLSAEATVLVTDKGWVEGTIFDQTGNKVPDIRVYLFGFDSTLFDYSKTNGFYSISNVPAGSYQVWTHAVAGVYLAASSEANAVVTSGETVSRNLTLINYATPPNTVPPTITP